MAIVSLLGAVAVAACGPAGGVSAAPQATPPPVWGPHDPPTRFDLAHAVALPPIWRDGELYRGPAVDARLPITLDGLTAYVASTTGMRSVDLTTGQVTGAVDARSPSSPARYPVTAPVFTTLTGRRVALTAFLETAAGPSGRTPGCAVEVSAMDTTVHRSVPGGTVAIPGGPTGCPPGAALAANVVGARGPIAIVGIGGRTGPGSVAAIDLSAPGLLWTRAAFSPAAVTDTQVVELTGSPPGARQVQALGLRSGSVGWTVPTGLSGNTTIAGLGPDVVGVSGFDANGIHILRFVSTLTGRTLSSVPTSVSSPQCVFDQRSVIVCAAPDRTLAVDSATGQELWQLADGDVAPDIAAAWHGVIYARTRAGQEYIDARTGVAHPDPDGINPLAVNEFAALAIGPGEPGGTLLAYPTL